MEITSSFDCSVHLKMTLKEDGEMEASVVACTHYDKDSEAKTSVQVPLSSDAQAQLKALGMKIIDESKQKLSDDLLGAVAKSREVGKNMGEL